MVDMKTETKPQSQNSQISQSKPVNPRDAIRERRTRRLRLIAAGKPNTIKVFAANETMREVLRHGGNGMRFRDSIDQGVEWPNDSFTARRIKEGSVRTDGPGSGEMAEPDETLNAREQAEANKPKSVEPAAKEESPPPKNDANPARPQAAPPAA